MNQKSLKLVAGAFLVLALLAPVASAHNNGPASSGTCGVVACETQAIANCSTEIEVALPPGGIEMPSLACARTDTDRYSSGGTPGENRGGISGRYVSNHEGAGLILDG